MPQITQPQNLNQNTQTQYVYPLIHLTKKVAFYHRQGPAFTVQQTIKVLSVVGKTLSTFIDCWDDGYPYTTGCYLAIVPTSKTRLVALEIETINDTSDPYIDETWYLIYINGKWIIADRDGIREVKSDNIKPDKLTDLEELKTGEEFY